MDAAVDCWVALFCTQVHNPHTCPAFVQPARFCDICHITSARKCAMQEDSTSYALKCNISIEVNHLNEGMKLALQDDREKNSDVLGRLALFKGASCISRLPPYLTVQMVRFFYKVDVQQKAKILRKVRLLPQLPETEMPSVPGVPQAVSNLQSSTECKIGPEFDPKNGTCRWRSRCCWTATTSAQPTTRSG